MHNATLTPEYMDSGHQRLSATGSDSSENDKQSVDGRSYASHPRGSLSNRQLPGGLSTSPRRVPKRSSQDGGEPKVSLVDVRPLWLEVPDDRKRYLLIEDLETGDVLMPLIYMKSVFEANYTRKLSTMNHRIVEVPPDSTLAHNRKATDHLCWIWAFESPKQVKLVVRKELREDSFPQGHLRLILLPIVYNAMSQKSQLRQLPLYAKLQAVMKASTYWPLLYHSAESRQKPEAEGEEDCKLFDGPRDYRQTQMKYMMNISEAQESEGGGKRSRQVYQYSTDAGIQGGMGSSNLLEAQLADLRDDFRRYKKDMDEKYAALQAELQKCGSFGYYLHQYLLNIAPPPPAILQPQHVGQPGLATPAQPSLARPTLQRGNSRADMSEESYPPPTIDSIPAVVSLKQACSPSNCD
eukprot:jgi/Botrbrau1/2942/Bobra.0026s0013.2